MLTWTRQALPIFHVCLLYALFDGDVVVVKDANGVVVGYGFIMETQQGEGDSQ